MDLLLLECGGSEAIIFGKERQTSGFAVPLIVEMDYILKLWLREPRLYTAMLCRRDYYRVYGFCTVLLMPPTLLRLFLACAASAITTALIAWFFALDLRERAFLVGNARKVIRRIKGSKV